MDVNIYLWLIWRDFTIKNIAWRLLGHSSVFFFFLSRLSVSQFQKGSVPSPQKPMGIRRFEKRAW